MRCTRDFCLFIAIKCSNHCLLDMREKQSSSVFEGQNRSLIMTLYWPTSRLHIWSRFMEKKLELTHIRTYVEKKKASKTSLFFFFLNNVAHMDQIHTVCKQTGSTHLCCMIGQKTLLLVTLLECRTHYELITRPNDFIIENNFSNVSKSSP